MNKTLNNFPMVYEISEVKSTDGRRNVKLILHEIYPTEDRWNENGITWLEEYAKNNLDTIIGLPICASFIDSEKNIPTDHGLTGIKDGKMPLFEDSEQVGSCYSGAIEDIEINGEIKRVCSANGYINEQRYPKFLEWLENQKLLENTVYGSVEIVGTDENEGKIIYRDGWKEEGRIPEIYKYSGHCLLSVTSADNTAILLELNQLKDNPVPNKEREVSDVMDEKQFEQLINDVKSAIAETNSKNDESEKTVAELNSQITELNASVEALRTALAAVQTERDELYAKVDETYAESNLLREEIAKAKVEQRIGELNSALSGYSDEEKAFAQEEIDAFNANPEGIEINSITMKIDASIYQKLKAAQIIAEQNSKKTDSTITDIFSEVNSTKPNTEELTNLDGMFA